MRKQITLPSGATCVVRKLSRMDFVGEDRLPQAFPASVAAPEPDQPLPPEAIDFAAKLGRIALTKACGAIVKPDGTRVRIVSKHLADCSDAEITVEEMDDRDADAIINAVSELTGMTREAGREAAPFPAGPASTPAV